MIIIDTSDLRLVGIDFSWHSNGKHPVKLKPLCSRISFLTIDATLARLLASSEMSHFFKASFNKLYIASLKTITTFFPSSCSCASLK